MSRHFHPASHHDNEERSENLSKKIRVYNKTRNALQRRKRYPIPNTGQELPILITFSAESTHRATKS